MAGSSGNDDSDDNVPLAQIVNKANTNKQTVDVSTVRDFTWIDDDFMPAHTSFDNAPSGFNTEIESEDVLPFFEHFFRRDIVNIIVEETNR